MIMSRLWTVFLLTGFIGGISLKSFVNFGWSLALFFIFLGIIILFLSLTAKESRFMILIAIFIISFGLGIARYELKDYKKTDLSEGRIILEGVIVDEPDERENYTRLVLKTNDAKILVYTNHYPEYYYGDKIIASGVLKKPQNINNSFDWVSYLAKDDVYFEMLYPEIEFVSAGQGS